MIQTVSRVYNRMIFNCQIQDLKTGIQINGLPKPAKDASSSFWDCGNVNYFGKHIEATQMRKQR